MVRRIPPVRDDLAGVEPYVSPQRPAKYRMNVNESPYPPPDAVLDEAFAAVRAAEVNRYPVRDADDLHRAVAERLGRRPEAVWVANGSNEVFQHLFLAYGGPGRRVLVFEPTYSLHTLIPRITATEVTSRPRTTTYEIDLDAARDAMRAEKPDVVLICSPNNPTGNIEAPSTVQALCEEASGLVVVDEAYIEFAPAGASVLDLLEKFPNLVVVRTFSKAWRIAGARLGYLTAHPEVVDGLRKVRLPYHLSAFTQALGVAALRYADDALDHVAAIVGERTRIASGLAARGIRAHRSDSNFVLFEVDAPDAVWNALLSRGVLVRNYAGTPGLERCLRVTAGLPEETDAFLSALDEAMKP
ncbi:MAG TPA: histidinol-phosphate transaminase [Actinomycetota bacterium]|nr:histidinol-phosphate transaminase [Actinomycetota bacterium]